MVTIASGDTLTVADGETKSVGEQLELEGTLNLSGEIDFGPAVINPVASGIGSGIGSATSTRTATAAAAGTGSGVGTATSTRIRNAIAAGAGSGVGTATASLIRRPVADGVGSGIGTAITTRTATASAAGGRTPRTPRRAFRRRTLAVLVRRHKLLRRVEKEVNDVARQVRNVDLPAKFGHFGREVNAVPPNAAAEFIE